MRNEHLRQCKPLLSLRRLRMRHLLTAPMRMRRLLAAPMRMRRLLALLLLALLLVSMA